MNARASHHPYGRERRKKKDSRSSEGIGHVIDTGLPPGISVDQAKDPGSQPVDRPPTEKRKAGR